MDVRKGFAHKLKKGDADEDNPLRFNVGNSRFMEDTITLQKKTKRPWLCGLCSPNIWGLSVLQNIPLYSLILNSLIKSLSILLHIGSEFIFIHMIIHLYYGYNLRKVIS